MRVESSASADFLLAIASTKLGSKDCVRSIVSIATTLQGAVLSTAECLNVDSQPD